MRRFLIVLGMIVGLTGPVAGQSSDIEATIGGQIEAFLADDFSRAFTFASPTIQNIFRTPENFGMMVRRGYPMVHRPADVRFLDLREVAGALWQQVQVTDAKGTVHLLDYQMVRMENGWKINAVQLLEAPGVSA